MLYYFQLEIDVERALEISPLFPFFETQVIILKDKSQHEMVGCLASMKINNAIQNTKRGQKTSGRRDTKEFLNKYSILLHVTPFHCLIWLPRDICIK